MKNTNTTSHLCPVCKINEMDSKYRYCLACYNEKKQPRCTKCRKSLKGENLKSHQKLCWDCYYR